MTRIIAGSVGGRTLAVPARGTRPTSDRVREALFTLLDHHDLLDGARVLDLYAGSGALGLEAASRGAADVRLVESDRRAAQVCRENARSLGLAQVHVTEARVESYLARALPSDHPGYSLVVIDPPYDVENDRVDQVLAAVVVQLDPHDAVVVVERATRSGVPTVPRGLELWQTRTYGETALHLFQTEVTDERTEIER